MKLHMLHRLQQPLKKPLLALSLACALFIGAVGSSFAVTQGYQTNDEGLQPGLVAGLSDNGDSSRSLVERASIDRLDRIVGVATTVEDSLVTVASAGQPVFIQTEGEVDAYVTDLAGTVMKGDLLTLSPIRGILAKDVAKNATIAIALEDFSVEEATSYPVEGKEGTREVLVQRVRVNLTDQGTWNNQESSSTIAVLGQSVVGRDVGETRVIIALIIFLIVLIAEGGIIYGAISSAITSLGRNPLARNFIRNELVRVLFVAIAVLCIGATSIYAILWI